MLKIAYQLGVEMAIKEAGFSQDDFEKLSRFLWYRDVAEAFPTFRELLGLNPEIGHRLLRTGKSVGKAGKTVEKQLYRYLSRPADPRMAVYNPRAFRKVQLPT